MGARGRTGYRWNQLDETTLEHVSSPEEHVIVNFARRACMREVHSKLSSRSRSAMPWRCFNHAVCGSSRPRASAKSVRCTGSACKAALTASRQPQGGTASTEGLVVAAAQAAAEEMPHGVSVHEVEEILGERCCKPTEMTKKKRKNGPLARICGSNFSCAQRGT